MQANLWTLYRQCRKILHAQTPDADTHVDALHSLLLHPKAMRMSR